MPDVLSPSASVSPASRAHTGRWTRLQQRLSNPERAADPLLVACFACLAFLVLGYHPYAEDGGIYAAALAAKLNPALFAHDRAWVTGHTRFSLFVPGAAGLLRVLRLSLPTGLLLLQIASLVATTAALLRLARLCFDSASVARWATLLVVLAAGLPIAGTSLYLIDPYPTARSVTTPLLLLALAACLRRRWAAATALWTAALALHPLMAAWGGLLLVLFWLADRGRHRSWAVLRFQAWPLLVLVATLLLLCGAVFAAAPPADPLTRTLAQTRAYWFLSQWHWYEHAGVVLPVLLLAAALRFPAVSRGWRPVTRPLAAALLLSASISLTLASLFARANGRTMAMARLQPLRTLHLFYAAFLLLFAGTLVRVVRQGRAFGTLAKAGRRVQDLSGISLRAGISEAAGNLTPMARHRSPQVQHAESGWSPSTAMLLAVSIAVAIPLMRMQRALYASSAHVELPASTPRNGWMQAFAWAREHSGTNDLFALDADYTSASGEDAQGFRAIALRSVLPDRAKDGGVAAVVPGLANAWQLGSTAQAGLNAASDTERRQRLLPLGADWLILPAASETKLHCPYTNAVARVCRLR